MMPESEGNVISVTLLEGITLSKCRGWIARVPYGHACSGRFCCKPLGSRIKSVEVSRKSGAFLCCSSRQTIPLRVAIAKAKTSSSECGGIWIITQLSRPVPGRANQRRISISILSHCCGSPALSVDAILTTSNRICYRHDFVERRSEFTDILRNSVDVSLIPPRFRGSHFC